MRAPPIFDPDSDIVTGPAVPGAPVEPVLRVDEIQGNVLPGFSSLVQTLLAIRIADQDAAKACLRFLAPQVSTLRQVNDARNVRRRAARSRMERPPSPIWMNVALSIEGLKVVGVPTARILDRSMKAGMYAPLSRALGDPAEPSAEGHVSRWRTGGSPDTIPHVLVIVAADRPEWVAQRVQELKRGLLGHAHGDPSRVTITFEETGTVMTDGAGGVGHEHFGFRDGISTLAPRGRLSDLPRHFLSRRYLDPADPRALEFAKPGQPLVWPGQFVFGYESQGRGEKAVAPGERVSGGYPWMDDGSLLVFRRLRQDVPRFRAAIASEAARISRMPGWSDLTSDRLAALLVGRWPNGTSLQVDPDRPAPAPMDDRLRVNHFAYGQETAPVLVCDDPFIRTEETVGLAGDELREVQGAPADPSGMRCPAFAHVRKTNPRDLQTDQGSPRITLAAQMLRRGITYGPPFPSRPDQAARDEADRGLHFLAYQTSFVDQFERLTVKWMNRPGGPEASSGHDLLVGQERNARLEATLSAAERPDIPVSLEGGWVIPTGGGYFFSPSISALHAMAKGTIPVDG